MPGSSRHPSPSSITSCFFYTRTVPCEFWFLDRAKPPERHDKVFMIDAGHVYRRATREIYDFSPERLANLSTNEYEILLAPGEIGPGLMRLLAPVLLK